MKTILAVILLLPFCLLNAQQIILLDETTAEPVEGASITGGDSTVIGYTDISGSFIFKNLSFDTYEITHTNYQKYKIEKSILATKTKHYLFMEPNDNVLKEVVFSIDHEQTKDQVNYQMEIVTRKRIEELAPSTSADLLMQTGNVMIQKSQQGGGSPILRGFEANRVLIVVDGVRMNNAIYRANHLQNVITIDPYMIERTEVIFGPASSLYGSDAMGGVMHFYTRNPRFAEKDTTYYNMFFNTTYQSNSGSFIAGVGVEMATEKTAYLTTVSRKQFGNMQIGGNRNHPYNSLGLILTVPVTINDVDSFAYNNNPNEMIWGGYEQLDVMHKQIYKTGEHSKLKFNFQYSTSSNVHRLDKMYEMRDGKHRFSEYYYGPQNRLLGLVNFSNNKAKGPFDLVNHTISYQRIDEDRISRKYQSSARKHLMEDVDVFGLVSTFSKIETKLGHFSAGYDIQHNVVNSSAYNEDIFTQEQSFELSRYPGDGSTMTSAGVFGFFSKKWKKTTQLSGGLRMNGVNINANFTQSPLFDFQNYSYSFNNYALTGNLGWKKTGKHFNQGVQWSTGYKVPNIDDFGKVFEKNGKVVVPNIDLKPEYSYNLDYTVDFHNEKFDFKIVNFATVVDNIIVEDDFLVNGNDSILFDNEMAKVKANVNKDKGWIIGQSFQLKYKFSEYLNFISNTNIQLGYEWNNGSSPSTNADRLSHIAPLFGKAEFRYTKRKMAYWFNTVYNGTKLFEDLSPKEQGDVLIDGQNYYGWYTLNTGFKYTVSNKLSLVLNGNNLLNTHYIPFTSDISGEGINFIISINGRF